MSIRLFLSVLLCAAALSAYADPSGFDHILRFDRIVITNQFPVSNNLLNYHSCENQSDWVTVLREPDDLHLVFIARKTAEYKNRPDAEIKILYHGSNSFGQAVSADRTYRFLCQWDDCGELEENKHSPGTVSKTPEDYDGPLADEDTWFFTPLKQAYCLEFSSSNDLKVVASQNGGRRWSNAVDVIEGRVTDAIRKRMYLTNLTLNSRLNFKITNPAEDQEQNVPYDLRLRPVRPLVLVHGIRSSPTDSSDPKSSFGDLAGKAFRYGDLPPALVFDFPWDSDKGCIYDYCGGSGDGRALFGFAFKRCGNWKLKPVFFTHSMGGLLLLEQLKNNGFKNFAEGLIFGGTPFCGSDLANYLYFKKAGNALHKIGSALNKIRTTEMNLLLLNRGTSWIWKRLEKIPVDLRALFITGDQINAYPVGLGDDTVNISSASLHNTLSWPASDHLDVGLDHGGITEIALPPGRAHVPILNKLKEMLEQQ